MKEIERRIFVNEKILLNEYEYVYGNRKNIMVRFSYYNVVRGRENIGRQMRYNDALALARNRARDKRYKNYEFFITTW